MAKKTETKPAPAAKPGVPIRKIGVIQPPSGVPRIKVTVAPTNPAPGEPPAAQ